LFAQDLVEVTDERSLHRRVRMASSANTRSSIEGAVLDSITNRPIAGAQVTAVEMARPSASTAAAPIGAVGGIVATTLAVQPWG
jgi:hypothetical protein